MVGALRAAALGISVLAAGGLLTGCSDSSTGGTNAATETPAETVTCANVAAPPETRLDSVRTAFTPVPGIPFGVVYTPDGKTAFASVQGNTIQVFTVGADGGLTPAGAVALPKDALAAQVHLTADGKYLLAASTTGAIVLDAAKAAAAQPDAVLGTLTGDVGNSAIQVTTTRDGRYAFVAVEYGNASTDNWGAVAVFDLRAALENGFAPDSHKGHITLSRAVVGMVIAPDGKTMFVTSENTREGGATGNGKEHEGPGVLSILDVNKLVSDPASATIADVTTGCNPVRAILTRDGKTLWLSSRSSNRVLGFDVHALEADPKHPKPVVVQVGSAPVGLALVDNERLLLVADSNRFDAPGGTTGITVVDTAAALTGKPANLGSFATGKFPREFAVSPDGKTALVSNFGSKQIQTIDLGTLPHPAS